MGFFDKLKTAADSTLVAMDKTAERMASRLSDTELLNKLVEHPNNKYYNAEAQRRNLS